MRRYELYTVSQSEIVTGLGYIYMHAESRTTVDHVLLDVGAASMAASLQYIKWKT